MQGPMGDLSSEKGANQGEQDGDLDPNQPRELAVDLRCQSVFDAVGACRQSAFNTLDLHVELESPVRTSMTALA
jgi:hypothetical protein